MLGTPRQFSERIRAVRMMASNPASGLVASLARRRSSMRSARARAYWYRPRFHLLGPDEGLKCIGRRQKRRPVNEPLYCQPSSSVSPVMSISHAGCTHSQDGSGSWKVAGFSAVLAPSSSVQGDGSMTKSTLELYRFDMPNSRIPRWFS